MNFELLNQSIQYVLWYISIVIYLYIYVLWIVIYHSTKAPTSISCSGDNLVSMLLKPSYTTQESEKVRTMKNQYRNMLFFYSSDKYIWQLREILKLWNGWIVKRKLVYFAQSMIPASLTPTTTSILVQQVLFQLFRYLPKYFHLHQEYHNDNDNTDRVGLLFLMPSIWMMVWRGYG